MYHMATESFEPLTPLSLTSWPLATYLLAYMCPHSTLHRYAELLQVEVPLKQDAQKKFVRQTSFWGRLGKWTNQVLGGPFHLDKGKVPSLDDQFTSLTGNEAGYTAQDAPSMRMPKITRVLRTNGRTRPHIEMQRRI